MTSEKGVECIHSWKRVVDESGPDGRWLMMCEKCSTTKYVDPPKEESGPDGKKLLVEA